MKKIRLIWLLGMIFLLAGCKGNQEVSEKSVNVNDFTLAGAYREDKADVYLIVKNVNNSYFQVMFSAAEDAANALDCNVYYGGSESSSDWEVQEKLMDIAAKSGAAAIILAPDDTVKLADKVQEIYAQGIAVIFVDAVVNTDSYDVCYMTDNFEAGQKASMEMLNHLQESGLSKEKEALIAIQAGRQSSQTVNERLAGFCQYWEQNAPEKWSIIDEVKSNGGDDSKALGIAEEFFEEYGNIKGVFGTNNGSVKGFAVYLNQNQRKDVAVVGFDYSDEMEALLENGYMASVMLQKQYDMAYKGIEAALEIKKGTFHTEEKLVDTGVITVNSQNVNEPEVREIIERN